MSEIADITTNLQDLIDTKADIKSAIEEKGGYVEGGLSSYPDAIYRLGSDKKLYVTDGMQFRDSTWTEMPSNFDLSNVTTGDHMFYNCYNMARTQVIDVTNFTNMDYMFCECQSLEECYLKGDPSKIESTINTFYDYQYSAAYLKIYYDSIYDWSNFINLIYSGLDSDNKKNFEFVEYNYE